MSLFQCDKCGGIENTALSHYAWNRMKQPELGNLCSECDPEIGKWHGRFEKRKFPIGTMETDREGNIRPKKKAT